MIQINTEKTFRRIIARDKIVMIYMISDLKTR